MASFDLTLPRLYLNLGENAWHKLAIASGLALSAYGIYKYFSNRKQLDMTNKAVFITGCDSGIGKGLAKHLDVKGCSVFAGCFTEKGAEELKQECSNRLKTVIIDVRSSESIARAYEFVLSNLPEGTKLWGVVNNAGTFGKRGPVEFLNRSDYLEVMQVNFLGPVDVTKTFLPLLKTSHGRIVNISSVIVILKASYASSYGASKCALLGFAESLRKEKNIWGIKVSTVLPGLFKTPMTLFEENQSTVLSNQWKNLPQEVRYEYGEDFLKEYINFHKEINDKAPMDLSPVVGDIEHALFAVNPKVIYRPDCICKFAYFMDMLPGGMLEKMMNKRREIIDSKIKINC